jgi:hypothetical protein
MSAVLNSLIVVALCLALGITATWDAFVGFELFRLIELALS